MLHRRQFDLGYIERLINVLRATSSDFCPNIRRAVKDELVKLNCEAANARGLHRTQLTTRTMTVAISTGTPSPVAIVA